jgi:uncharacterized protein YjiS (DUF1127 family)
MPIVSGIITKLLEAGVRAELLSQGSEGSGRRGLIMRLETFERGMFPLDTRIEREPLPLRTRFGDIVRRGSATIAAARNARARRVTRRHLATLSDPILRDLGFTPDEIRLIRERRWSAHPHWHWP